MRKFATKQPKWPKIVFSMLKSTLPPLVAIVTKGSTVLKTCLPKFRTPHSVPEARRSKKNFTIGWDTANEPA